MSLSSRFRSIARRLIHNDLPSSGPRLVFMLLSLVFVSVEGGLCLKIWTKHHGFQKLLNHNLPSGTSAVLEYQDVKTTSILLFVACQLLTMVVSHIFLAMLQDIFHIIPPFLLRRFKMTLPQQPISSVTLPHQVIALLFTTVCVIIASAFHADFVFTRSGTLAVRQGSLSVAQATIDRLGIVLRYRDVQSIRVSAELPWPAIFFSLGANIVTLSAWYEFRRTPPPSPTAEDSISDIAEVEKSSELKDDGTKGEKGGAGMVIPV